MSPAAWGSLRPRLPAMRNRTRVPSPSGGLSVLKRRGRTFGEAAHDLAQQLAAFCRMDRRQRIQLRNDVERSSWDFDWSVLGAAYDHAHDLALIRAGVGA